MTILICFIILLSMSIPAMAAGGYPKIVDEADLLTSSEEVRLEQKAEELAEKYGIDVVILTVDSLHGKDITAYADDFFNYNGYGIGSDYSGVLFMLSMEYRDWAISTCGKAIDALTDYGQEKLFDEISGGLADDRYYDAFDSYLEELDYYFQCYEDGSPIDAPVSLFNILTKVLFGLAIGVIVAFLIVTVMSRGMVTARAQKGAQSYVTPGSYDLYVMNDLFLYSHTTKVKKAESNSGSGGSSTHRSSSGRSHGGSRGKF